MHSYIFADPSKTTGGGTLTTPIHHVFKRSHCLIFSQVKDYCMPMGVLCLYIWEEQEEPFAPTQNISTLQSLSTRQLFVILYISFQEFI